MLDGPCAIFLGGMIGSIIGCGLRMLVVILYERKT